MIVRALRDILGTDRDVDTPRWASRRLLLKADGMGFSMHDTLVRAGTETEIWYKHHLEACYCVEGRGTLEMLPAGPTHRIEPGTLYALDGHERHRLRADSDLRLVCVFAPALTGREVHDAEGTYPLLG
jgi:L-ectoine synthase